MPSAKLPTPDELKAVGRQMGMSLSDADVAFFFKQWGGRTPKAEGRVLDGQLWGEMPCAAS